MRTLIFLLSLPVVTAATAAERRPVGIFFRWGAFEETEPRRCFAITEPVAGPRAGEWRPYASVGYWPDRGRLGQVHVRLSRAKRKGSAILLQVDGRSFQLVGGGADAWAPDARADAAIVAAMRAGAAMSVETRAQNGALIRDRYALKGAPSAIDAAAVACARR